MTRRSIRLAALVIALASLAACGGGNDTTAPPVAADVDGYLKSLPTWDEFSPAQADANVMVTAPRDTTELVGSREYECTVSSYSLTATPREIVVFSPDADILWPGSLLQGDKYAGGLGSLGELPIRQRAPLKLFTDLLTSDVTRTVQDPDAASVASAVGDLIQLATDAGHVAGSSIDFDQKTTWSLEQAALDLGISVNYMGTQVESSLAYEQSAEEHTLTAYFTQKMFTVSVVQPQTPSEFFSADFTAERLNQQVELGRIGPDNPPTYISSVVYGRMLILTMTSSESVENMRAALTASRDGIGSGSVAGEHLQVLQNSRLQVTTVGGVDDGVEGLITSGRLGEYFAADAPLTSARPLSYTVRNLADNSLAKVSETTEYNIRSCAPAARTVTGARYKVTIDKIKVTDLGCDWWPDSAGPEVYYSYSLTSSSGTVGMASLGAGSAVTVDEGGELVINSGAFYMNLYKDGRQGTTKITGTAWDEDALSADNVIGTWNISYAYGAGTGQKTYASSGSGCGVSLYVTLSRVGDLYD